MITGTCHFPTLDAAHAYYVPYGYQDTAAVVFAKVRAGEIKIGPPPLKPGQRAFVHPQEKRFFIEG